MFTKIKDYILLKLGVTELKHRLDNAEQKLNDRFDFLGAYMNLVQSEDLTIDPIVADRAKQRLKGEYGVDNINMIIHKNDVMFAMHVFGHRHDVEEAVYTHFRIGVATAKNLKTICDEHSLKPKGVLDFGSGYGRVSRFLPQYFAEAQISVSEVKQQALNFQKRQFGFSTVFHGQHSESFKLAKQDLILAVSVFTHLPKDAFITWLNELIETLNPGGALIFTFNNSEDKKYTSVTRGKDFMYQTQSEDQKFSFLSDSLKDTGQYGHSFVTHKFLEELLKEKSVEYSFLGNRLTRVQEALWVRKK